MNGKFDGTYSTTLTVANFTDRRAPPDKSPADIVEDNSAFRYPDNGGTKSDGFWEMSKR